MYDADNQKEIFEEMICVCVCVLEVHLHFKEPMVPINQKTTPFQGYAAV